MGNFWVITSKVEIRFILYWQNWPVRQLSIFGTAFSKAITNTKIHFNIFSNYISQGRINIVSFVYLTSFSDFCVFISTTLWSPLLNLSKTLLWNKFLNKSHENPWFYNQLDYWPLFILYYIWLYLCRMGKHAQLVVGPAGVGKVSSCP